MGSSRRATIDAAPQLDLGPYRLDALLGKGGMGEVYKAWDSRLERWVAVKHLLAAGDDRARARFRREARLVAKLRHPAVVQVHDVLETEDGDWLVMELVEGPNLRQLLGDGPLDVGLVLDYGRQIAAGLAAAHREGIVHRDLKTENVMVTPSGEVRILDFGLAKQLRAPDGESLSRPDLSRLDLSRLDLSRPNLSRTDLSRPNLSRTGQIMGTPRAMSPEQALGREAGAATDLFALGVLLYEALSARSPFRADSFDETLERVVTQQQATLRRLVPRVPRALSDLVDRLLEKDLVHRPASAELVEEELRGIAEGGSAATPAIHPAIHPADHSAALNAAEQGTLLSAMPVEKVALRTLLMSDLVDSTRLVAKLGDRDAAALFRRHNELTRDLLAARKGVEIDQSDGFLMLFERPWDALSFALAYHRGLRDMSEESGTTLLARVGIHLGEVVLCENSPEYVARGAKPLEVEGIAKPTTARLMGLAEGGQTLLTRSAYEVARRAPVERDNEESLVWLEHGLYRFKDVEDPVEIFEVGEDGLGALRAPVDGVKAKRLVDDAAPEMPSAAKPLCLRRFAAPELPVQPYPVLLPYTHPALLAGRDRELKKLLRALRQPQSLVMLCAPSGTGKSSLLLGGLLPALRAEGRPAALTRHPQESGLARCLMDELVEGGEPLVDGDWRGFAARIEEVETLAGEAPVLVLDQFEEVLRTPATRARVGTLLAATALRRAGFEAPSCRWVLAVRKESQGEVMVWLRDVLAEARASVTGEGDGDVATLPHDLSEPERLESMALPPLATVRSGRGALETATRVFEEAISRPLALRGEDGAPLYAWLFAEGHAERLARAFAESRLTRPQAPLGPELQVVLAHLLACSVNGVIEVHEEPGELIETALEDHLRRALETTFQGEDGATGRTRALLALHELATVSEQSDEGLAPEQLIAAIGEGGEEVLAWLSSPLTRLVVEVEAPEGLRYMLAHDRLVEVVARLVEEEGRHGRLVIDRELLALRRVVSLRSALYASGEAGSEELAQATRLSRRHFLLMAAHEQALLWDGERRSWWAACRRRRLVDQVRRAGWLLVAFGALALVVFGAWTWAKQWADHRQLLEQVAQGEASLAFAAFERLRQEEVGEEELLAVLEQREIPSEVLERGLGGLVGEERSVAVLAMVGIMLPSVLETPEDPVLLANLTWALDYTAGRDPAFAERAGKMRDQVLAPLRQLRPPPALPAMGDPDWIDIPAGSFLMGTAEDGEGDDHERPQHEVTVSAFRLQRHEVTNAEYRQLVQDHPGKDDHPAHFRSWYAAATYAAWLGGRLPNEAEWEYAARAGCEFAYCDGEGRETSVDAVAWTLRNSQDAESGGLTAQRVMELAPNPWKLYDMLGNLWEWTGDWYGPYKAEVTEAWGPAGPASSGSGRVYRGGAFWNQADWARVAYRYRDDPSVVSVSLGCRVALPLPVAPSR